MGKSLPPIPQESAFRKVQDFRISDILFESLEWELHDCYQILSLGQVCCFSLAAIVQARIEVQKRILLLLLTENLTEMSMSKRCVNVTDLSYAFLA
jgi:hypothetical protein